MLSFVWPGANSVGWIWGERVGAGEKTQGDLFNRCDPRGPLPGTVSCPLGFLLFSNNSDCTSGKILKRICEEKAMCYFFFFPSKHILTRDTICVLLDLIWEKKNRRLCFRSGEFQAAAPERGTLLTLCNLQIWMFSMASSELPLHHGRGLLSSSQSGLQSAHPPAWNLHSLQSAEEGSECSSDPYCPESIAPGLKRTGHSPEPRTPRVPAFRWSHNTFMLTSEGGVRASHNMCKNHKTVYNYPELKSAGQGYPRHLWLIANRSDLSVPLETIRRNTNHDLWLLFVRHDFSFWSPYPLKLSVSFPNWAPQIQ